MRHYLGCQCEPKDRSRWVVVDRHCNYSAFNGYRWTPSDYSKVVCMRCGVPWRTKAAYVDTLPDAPEDWYNRLGAEGEGASSVTVTPSL